MSNINKKNMNSKNGSSNGKSPRKMDESKDESKNSESLNQEQSTEEGYEGYIAKAGELYHRVAAHVDGMLGYEDDAKYHAELLDEGKAGEHAKEKFQQGKEKVTELVDQAKEKIQGTQEKGKEKISGMKEKMHSNQEKGKGKTSEFVDHAKEKLHETKEKGKEKMSEFKEKMHDKQETNKGKISEFVDQAKEKIQETKEKGKEKLSEWKDKFQGSQEESKGKTSDFMDNAKEKLHDTKEKVKGKMDDAKEKITGKVQQAKQSKSKDSNNMFEGLNDDEEREIEGGHFDAGDKQRKSHPAGSISASNLSKISGIPQTQLNEAPSNDHISHETKNFHELGKRDEKHKLTNILHKSKPDDQLPENQRNNLSDIGENDENKRFNAGNYVTEPVDYTTGKMKGPADKLKGQDSSHHDKWSGSNVPSVGETDFESDHDKSSSSSFLNKKNKNQKPNQVNSKASRVI